MHMVMVRIYMISWFGRVRACCHRGTERLRITPGPVHSLEDLLYLVDSIDAVWQKLDIPRCTEDFEEQETDSRALCSEEIRQRLFERKLENAQLKARQDARQDGDGRSQDYRCQEL